MGTSQTLGATTQKALLSMPCASFQKEAEKDIVISIDDQIHQAVLFSLYIVSLPCMFFHEINLLMSGDRNTFSPHPISMVLVSTVSLWMWGRSGAVLRP